MFFVLAYWYITYPHYPYIAIESTKGVGIFWILWDFSQKNIRPPTARAKCGLYKCHTKTILQDFTTTTTNTPRDSLVSSNTLFMYNIM